MTSFAATTTVVGEGTYGCVLRPPLTCSRDQDVHGRPVDYTGKVSKLMDVIDAQEEEAKYETMEQIDPDHHFHYPTPMRCFLPTDPTSGKVTNAVQDRILQCKAQKEIMAHLEDYQLLLMQDGGVDLLGFTQHIWDDVRAIQAKVRPNSRSDTLNDLHAALNDQVKRLKRFWENAIILFYGLQRLKDATGGGGWVHNDLKPHNVVYLEEENRVAMIDFGMLQRVEDMVRAANANDYDFARFHWNFPPEMYFYHRIRFTHLQRMSDTDRATFYMVPYRNAVQHNSRRTQTMREKVDGNYPAQEYNESLRSLASVLNIDDDRNSIHAVCMGFMQFIQTVPRDVPFEDFLRRSISTLDVYGLGVALLYVMNQVGDLDDASLKGIHDDLMNLFSAMCESNLYERLSLERALAGYQEILHKHGLRVHEPPSWETRGPREPRGPQEPREPQETQETRETREPTKTSKLRVRGIVPADEPSVPAVPTVPSVPSVPSTVFGTPRISHLKIDTPDAPERNRHRKQSHGHSHSHKKSRHRHI